MAEFCIACILHVSHLQKSRISVIFCQSTQIVSFAVGGAAKPAGPLARLVHIRPGIWPEHLQTSCKH